MQAAAAEHPARLEHDASTGVLTAIPQRPCWCRIGHLSFFVSRPSDGSDGLGARNRCKTLISSPSEGCSQQSRVEQKQEDGTVSASWSPWPPRLSLMRCICYYMGTCAMVPLSRSSVCFGRCNRRSIYYPRRPGCNGSRGDLRPKGLTKSTKRKHASCGLRILCVLTLKPSSALPDRNNHKQHLFAPRFAGYGI
jgi:hypothetical protein